MDSCGGIHYILVVNCKLILFNTQCFIVVGMVTDQTYILPLLNKSHLYFIESFHLPLHIYNVCVCEAAGWCLGGSEVLTIVQRVGALSARSTIAGKTTSNRCCASQWSRHCMWETKGGKKIDWQDQRDLNSFNDFVYFYYAFSSVWMTLK